MGLRRQKRSVASVMILSLVLKLVIAAVHVPMTFAATATKTSDLSATASSGLEVVICGPSGVRKVVFDKNGTPTELPVGPSNISEACALCAALHVAACAMGVDHEQLAGALSYGQKVEWIATALFEPKVPRCACGHDPPAV